MCVPYTSQHLNRIFGVDKCSELNSDIEMPKSNFGRSLHHCPAEISLLFLSDAFVTAASEMDTSTYLSSSWLFILGLTPASVCLFWNLQSMLNLSEIHKFIAHGARKNHGD